ncbi:pyridoxamine 5'-phosphate oxidase [Derxia gummosa]|uniref:Pyridoxine/pyridoxamine 5'-phosphate oxidase n=1 Tax=Derxia gummosa DSM 723 TaxID=1121388 RepID=A0A8B6X1C1_9BURK|nr:pyridoxamine 5'-phosphate oxidase [Derxia gummosa]
MTTPLSLADIRTDYARAALDEAAVHADPLAQFAQWFAEAQRAEIPEPNAMTLATIGLDGRPKSRVVLVKGLDNGFSFFTNYTSNKGRELAANPFAALQFHWVQLERQVRIEGKVEKLSPAESDAYYHSRPVNSRLGAWASPQSQVIPDRAFLEAREAEYRVRLGDSPQRPEHWGGYRLVPDVMEFWQGRPSRLHDRLRYVREAGGWRIERLAP